MPSVVTSHAVERDHLLRALEKQKSDFQSLLKEKERIARVAERKEAEFLRLHRTSESKTRAAEQARRTVEALARELKAAQQKATEEHQRRGQLEHKVSAGQFPKLMAEKLMRMKSRLSAALASEESSSQQLEECRGDLQSSQREVSTLLRALEVRLHEAGPAVLLPPEEYASSSSSSSSSVGAGGDDATAQGGGERGVRGRGDVSSSGSRPRGIYNMRGSSSFYERGGDEEDRQREVRASLLYQYAQCQQSAVEEEGKTKHLREELASLRGLHADLKARFVREQSCRSEAEARGGVLTSELAEERRRSKVCGDELSRVEDQLADTVSRVEDLSRRCLQAEESQARAGAQAQAHEAELNSTLEKQSSELETLRKEGDELRQRTLQRSSVTDMAQQRLSSQSKALGECRERAKQEAAKALALEQELGAGARECARWKGLSEEWARELELRRAEVQELVRAKNQNYQGAEQAQRELSRRKAEVERVAGDFAHLKRVHDESKEEAASAHAAQQLAEEKESQAAKDAAALRAELGSLETSKQLLQRAMLEQLSHARKELREEQARRTQAELQLQQQLRPQLHQRYRRPQHQPEQLTPHSGQASAPHAHAPDPPTLPASASFSSSSSSSSSSFSFPAFPVSGHPLSGSHFLDDTPAASAAAAAAAAAASSSLAVCEASGNSVGCGLGVSGRPQEEHQNLSFSQHHRHRFDYQKQQTQQQQTQQQQQQQQPRCQYQEEGFEVGGGVGKERRRYGSENPPTKVESEAAAREKEERECKGIGEGAAAERVRNHSENREHGVTQRENTVGSGSGSSVVRSGGSDLNAGTSVLTSPGSAFERRVQAAHQQAAALCAKRGAATTATPVEAPTGNWNDSGRSGSGNIGNANTNDSFGTIRSTTHSAPPISAADPGDLRRDVVREEPATHPSRHLVPPPPFAVASPRSPSLAMEAGAGALAPLSEHAASRISFGGGGSVKRDTAQLSAGGISLSELASADLF